jgi:potassium voltage-gated channel Shal-related subfamily D protein 2
MFLLDFLGTFFFCFTYVLYNTFNYTGHYAAIDLLSTIRVARMFKLCNLHPRLKVITKAIAYSSSLLNLTMFFCLFAMMIAGSALYYAERLSNQAESQIISVMDGMWLAISTISTLGPGDIVPRSLAGMMIGAITTVIGVLIIDLPMPIIVEIFANYNTHLQARQQLPKQRRRITPAAIPRKIQPFMPPNGHTHAY